MDMDLLEFSRSRYTVFDLLADVGGISGMFASLFAVFMAAWNFNALDNLLVTRLFKAKLDDKRHFNSQSDFFPNKGCPNFIDYFLSWIPSCMLCCKRSQKEKAYARARDRLEKELDIIEVVKSRRYFAKALKTLLPKD